MKAAAVHAANDLRISTHKFGLEQAAEARQVSAEASAATKSCSGSASGAISTLIDHPQPKDQQ
jgi:hypothetical protein